MRWLLALLLVMAPPAIADEPVKIGVDLSGEIEGRGLRMAEADRPVHQVHLTARVDKKGEGDGTLTLDVTPRAVDEFGFPKSVDALPPVKLACSLKLLKTRKILVDDPASGTRRAEVEWRLFEINGPKIKSRLSLAAERGSGWAYAHFMVLDKDGSDRDTVRLHGPRPLVPCHPGCFPAGTLILVPGGYRDIDTLRAGDVVTTIDPDGVPGHGTVEAVFVTRNRLFEVETEAGTLTTTETQPLAIAGGGLRAAGALKPGDRIHSWDGQQRRTVAVRSVTETDREARVLNLVLDEPVLFVAGGFLARSKPPADHLQP